MAIEIDNDNLISLVQERPILWDNSIECYKDRDGTKTAWREVCLELRNDFETLEDKEKKEFGQSVIKRWSNLRDAYRKFLKKAKEQRRSGATSGLIKKYIYKEQMQFMSHLFEERSTADSLTDASFRSEGISDNEEPLPEVSAHEKKSEHFGRKKRRKPDELELKMIQALEPEKPNAHMAFFQSIMPNVEKYNEAETLKFRMSVLKIISDINIEKERAQAPPANLYQNQLLAFNQQPSSSFQNSRINVTSNYNPPSSDNAQSFTCFSNINPHQRSYVRRESEFPINDINSQCFPTTSINSTDCHQESSSSILSVGSTQIDFNE